MHEGHRSRMYERLLENGKMEDHELLEILLFSCLPRVNTNDIAHRLLLTFGSLANVFKAEYEQLALVEGVGKKTAQQLIVFGRLMERIAALPQEEAPVAYTFESFSNFLGKRFAKERQEFIEIYGVKKNGKLTFCRRFTSDEMNSVKLPAAELARFVGNFNPQAVILAHNHPNGEPRPSGKDHEFTKKVCLYFSMCDLEVLDHFIVSPKGIFSYRMAGLMDEMKAEYTFGKVMGILK